MKMDHVAVRVADMERAIGFYRDKLGLPLMFDQTDEAHHERFAFLELEGGNIELLQILGEDNQPLPYTPPAPDASNCPHIALSTDNLDAMLEKCGHENIPVLRGPFEIPGQVRWVYLLDPDTNILEFVQWTKEA